MYTVWFTQSITGDLPFVWDNYISKEDAQEVADALPFSEYHENITKAWIGE